MDVVVEVNSTAATPLTLNLIESKQVTLLYMYEGGN